MRIVRRSGSALAAGAVAFALLGFSAPVLASSAAAASSVSASSSATGGNASPADLSWGGNAKAPSA